jgi:hypothetical protein
VGATIVATGGVGDTFVIDNTGTTDNCVITATALLTGEEDDHHSVGAGIVTPGGGNSGTITIVNSGTFTISSSGTGTPSRSFVIDACSLEGAGVAASPWQVSDKDDLNLVGYSEESDDDSSGYVDSCVLSGHYLQSADISNVDTDADGGRIVVDDVFTGTYDGDHYSISYTSEGGDYEGRGPLFEELGPGGVIKRLSLTGIIRSNTTESSSLVERLYGGTISEVESSVTIQVDEDNDAVIGGLAARAGNGEDSLIVHSKFDGRLEWIETGIGSSQEGPTIGGLIGIAGTEFDWDDDAWSEWAANPSVIDDAGITEIRDSYSRASISFNSRGLTNEDGLTLTDAAIYAGGVLGSDGENELDEDENGASRVHGASNVRLIRTYFAGSFTNTCSGSTVDCNTNDPSHVFTGALIGVSEDLNDANDLFLSAFWLESSATNAVGEIVDAGPQPREYSAASPALPVAPGLSTSVLRTLSTYKSRENSAVSGEPSGLTDLVEGSSTDGTVTEQDYLWAMESGNVQTFVPSSYVDEADFLTRAVFVDTAVEKTYRREGSGDLTAHGGDDSRTVTGYPTLGRVWEICTNSNDGYPFLVWEELDCSASGGGGDSSGGNPGGLSDAEYAEFLRSGLTLADFLARRLAATGPSDAALGLGGLSAVLLGLVGAALVLIARRQVSRKPR